jgi:NAD(P)-dependent dehydrogenase (short-subunit alcohol dehydrogenase family)
MQVSVNNFSECHTISGIQTIAKPAWTKENIEATFGVNHLAHFLLVNLLLSELKGPARIVFVGSGTHDPKAKTAMPFPGKFFQWV